jgi:hypothetical protein
MNKRWMMLVGLMALVAAGATFLFFSRDGDQRALEETRRALRQQGFKIDDHGNRCTNENIDSVLQVTLPGSGRSQTLKGP